jgi:hypothetical protein
MEASLPPRWHLPSLTARVSPRRWGHNSRADSASRGHGGRHGPGFLRGAWRLDARPPMSPAVARDARHGEALVAARGIRHGGARARRAQHRGVERLRVRRQPELARILTGQEARLDAGGRGWSSQGEWGTRGHGGGRAPTADGARATSVAVAPATGGRSVAPRRPSARSIAPALWSRPRAHLLALLCVEVAVMSSQSYCGAVDHTSSQLATARRSQCIGPRLERHSQCPLDGGGRSAALAPGARVPPPRPRPASVELGAEVVDGAHGLAVGRAKTARRRHQCRVAAEPTDDEAAETKGAGVAARQGASARGEERGIDMGDGVHIKK